MNIGIVLDVIYVHLINFGCFLIIIFCLQKRYSAIEAFQINIDDPTPTH